MCSALHHQSATHVSSGSLAMRRLRVSSLTGSLTWPELCGAARLTASMKPRMQPTRNSLRASGRLSGRPGSQASSTCRIAFAQLQAVIMSV